MESCDLQVEIRTGESFFAQYVFRSPELAAYSEIEELFPTEYTEYICYAHTRIFRRCKINF